MNTGSARDEAGAEPRRSGDLIFDFGMYFCEDTDFYLRKGFRVVAIEANPVACRDAERRNAQAIASGQLTVVNRAISRVNEPLRFYLNTTEPARSTASERLREFWSARGESFDEIEVMGVVPSELIARYGVPYYAKIDIEGFDLLCVRAFAEFIEKPRYMSVEIDFSTSRELMDQLEKMGYCRFSLVGQSTVPSQIPPLNAREGQYADYRFNDKCTGLFGRELPLEWFDRRTADKRIRAVIRQYRLAGMLERFAKIGIPIALIDAARQRLPLAGDWYDLHAELIS
ncbi:MAG TPA: FkbM family methyltransferase [Stellaceae bacterium]|jgi:FkbM family methyltransferase|nr:FkbM family methyltransferase [Stellaceae bacterium]